MSSVAAQVSVEDLLLRGFFHDRVVPPLNSLGLKPAVGELVAKARGVMAQAVASRYRPAVPVRSQCSQHSVPKRKHLRRVLSIPNPLHQSLLCCEIVDNWEDLVRLCGESQVSLSMPVVSKKRALESKFDRRHESVERARRSIGARYVLKADLARYYPSIYTHSIAWAIHGKAAARADGKYALFGNRLDLWMRETQDRQTGGIPIGPDSSFLLAEVLASRLDKALQDAFDHTLRGTRYIDDYNLYFPSLSDAEKALAVLHGAARQYELEINDLKTDIVQVPEPLEPSWKTELRSMELRSDDHATSIKALFDKTYELARIYPQDSVLTYTAKKILSAEIPLIDWAVCEVLLLRSALGEPGMLPWLLRIYTKFKGTKSSALQETIESLCRYHSPLYQVSEIAWSLWIARALGIRISEATARAVVNVDDDIVALVSLDMMKNGLMPNVPTAMWESHINAGSLYSDHWLLAYEAHEQGWIRPKGGSDYVGDDPNGVFQILRKHGVRFYDPTATWEGGSEVYVEEDAEEVEESDDSDVEI